MVRVTVAITLTFLCSLFALCASPAPQEYRLGPEDAIVVTVLRHPEVSGPVTVAPDGTIQLPVIGQLPVTGKTLAELTTQLKGLFAQRFVAPEVTVSLVQPRKDRVFVLGAVGAPGIYPWKSGERITEALAAAGGLAVSIADCKATLLRGASGETISVVLRDALSGVEGANLVLDPGDVLNIERTPTLTIYVTGEVGSPGLYQLQEGSGVTEALALAGGLRLKADEVRIVVVRGKGTIAVDPMSLESESSTHRTMLQLGDIVRVDSKLIKVYVNGAVKTPGAYALRDGLGLFEALTLAGGANETAALGQVLLTHNDGAQETVDTVTLAAAAKNIVLRADDRITVPESTSRIAVLGHVTSPGFFPMDEKRPFTVAEAISMAKGVDKRGAMKAVSIIRVENGNPVRIPVNLEAILRKADVAANITLLPGDIIYVPETSKPDWDFVLRGLSAVGILNNILF